MTTDEIRRYFECARREGLPFDPLCQSCGRHGCVSFAAAFRYEQVYVKRRCDPGNLCACCAVLYEQLADEIRDGGWQVGNVVPFRRRDPAPPRRSGQGRLVGH